MLHPQKLSSMLASGRVCQVPSRILLLVIACICALLCPASADDAEAVSPPVLWKYTLDGYTTANYETAVKRLFSIYEQEHGQNLVPGEKQRVGLKVFTGSGAGLATPRALVQAVINELTRRGFKRNNIFIVDQRRTRLRESGFYPPISTGKTTFNGSPIYPLDSKKYYHNDWFYKASLSSRELAYSGKLNLDDRKSYLPVPLLHKADFWINLPMVTSHKATGVSGAVANMTLFNMSNYTRFLDNPLHAQVAMAEIYAIPEVQDSYAFTLLSLERYQCIGGFLFRSLYCNTEPQLLLSKSAPAVDYYMLPRINRLRDIHFFKPLESPPSFLEYTNELGLGDISDLTVVNVR